MEQVRLGKTGLKVSRLCLGCMTYGSPEWRSWVLDRDHSKPFFRSAIEKGITTEVAFFGTDTARRLVAQGRQARQCDVGMARKPALYVENSLALSRRETDAAHLALAPAFVAGAAALGDADAPLQALLFDVDGHGANCGAALGAFVLVFRPRKDAVQPKDEGLEVVPSDSDQASVHSGRVVVFGYPQ